MGLHRQRYVVPRDVPVSLRTFPRLKRKFSRLVVMRRPDESLGGQKTTDNYRYPSCSMAAGHLRTVSLD
jgi:hypothetical protein